MENCKKSNNLTQIEDEINKLGLDLVALINVEVKNTENFKTYTKKYTAICEKCYEWVSIHRGFKNYFQELETSNYGKIGVKNEEKHFEYSQELIESLIDSIKSFKPEEGKSSFINYFTVTVFNSIKKACYENKYGITKGNKSNYEISQLEKFCDNNLESKELKDYAISHGLITLKDYEKLLKYKLECMNLRSLESPCPNKEYDEYILSDIVQSNQIYDQTRYDKRQEIFEKLFNLLKIVYKGARSNSKKNKSLAYTYFVLPLLIEFTDSEIKKICQKYVFINEDAVLHYKNSGTKITKEDFSRYTGANRIEEYISDLKDFANEDQELCMLKDYLDSAY